VLKTGNEGRNKNKKNHKFPGASSKLSAPATVRSRYVEVPDDPEKNQVRDSGRPQNSSSSRTLGAEQVYGDGKLILSKNQGPLIAITSNIRRLCGHYAYID
jgi:hypothetical protein